MSTPVAAFYNLFEEFMCDIETVFPEYRAKVLKYNSALSIARRTNGRAFVKEFYNHISPHEKQILDCDDEHFLKKDPKELGISGETAEMCNIVKDIWMDDSTGIQTKAKIWKYIQGLYILSKSIVG